MPRFITKSDAHGRGRADPGRIGLFGVSEVLVNVERRFKQEVLRPRSEAVSKPAGLEEKYFPHWARYPHRVYHGYHSGMSVVIPTFVSYVVERGYRNIRKNSRTA
jgi:hypothetical protein